VRRLGHGGTLRRMSRTDDS